MFPAKVFPLSPLKLKFGFACPVSGKAEYHSVTGHESPEVQLYSFLNLGVIWGWVVKATPRPLYPRERQSD